MPHVHAKAIFILLFISGASSCTPGHSNEWWNKQLSFNKVIALASEVRNEHDLSRLYTLEQTARDEPYIDTFRHETYSYRYIPSFRPVCILRAEQLADSSYQLTSKCIVDRHYIFRTEPKHAFKWIRNYLFADDSSKLYSEKQKLGKREWDTFKSIIVKSGYWTFEDGPVSVSTDGCSLDLASKSIWPNHLSHDTLSYHINHISNPEDEAYRTAYNYLAKKSILHTRYGFWLGAL